MFETIKAWAKTLKRQIFILYFACKDQRVPWYAKTITSIKNDTEKHIIRM